MSCSGVTATFMTLFTMREFALPPLLYWGPFHQEKPRFYEATNPQPGHACRMSCDLRELLEQTRPPDEELVDLIEQAFLDGQIDGKRADLAYLWLRGQADFPTLE